MLIALGVGGAVWFWQSTVMPEHLFRPPFAGLNEPPFDVATTMFEGQPVTELIHKALHGNDHERARAVFGLGHVHHGCHQHIMHSVFRGTPDAEVRLKLAYTRRGIVGPRAAAILPILLQTLTDPSPRVRAATACTLEMMDAEAFGACDALRKALEDPDAATRLWAARALYSIRFETEAPIACNVKILAEDPSPRNRSIAAYNLQLMGNDASSVIPALTNACKDPDPDVRKQAAQALASIR